MSDIHGSPNQADLAPGEDEVVSVKLRVLGYLVGLGLAILLTATSFFVAGTNLVWQPSIPVAIIVLAIAQMGVHLVFFLHITTGPDNTNNVLALAFGLVAAAAVAAFVAYFSTRLRDIYFAITTLIFSQIFYVIIFTWTEVTGGENGLGGVVRPSILGIDFARPWTYYWLVAALAFLAVYLLWRFHRSAVGHVLVAIRENERRVELLGYDARWHKLVIFALSGAIAGLAGALFAPHGVTATNAVPGQKMPLIMSTVSAPLSVA